MKKFLIQTFNGKIVYDFTFHLLKAIEYHNWYATDQDLIEVEFAELWSDLYKDMIPVGSVEFVHRYMEQVENIYNHIPINIPKELNIFEFLGREVTYGSKDKKGFYNLIEKTSFVKSNTKVKGFVDMIQVTNHKPVILQDDLYLISEPIEIESEWRGFVHNNVLLDVRNYSGDTLLFPDIDIIKKMVKCYSEAPIAYTIDVAITKEGKTVLIECHNFYSCGLYGFQDYRKLPIMLSQWYNQYLKKNKK